MIQRRAATMFKRSLHLRLLTAALSLCAPPAYSAEPATQPASISLRLTNATAKQAIAELAKSAHVPIPLNPPDLLNKEGLPAVNLELKGASFWAAVREIGLQTGLEPNLGGDDPYPRFQLALGGGKFWKTPQAIAGPLLIAATDVSRSSTVELGRTKHEHQRDLMVNFAAYAEPGIRLLAVSPEIKLLQAVDDKGNSLLPTGHAPSVDEGDAEGYGGESGAIYLSNMSINLSCPENRGRKIASLKGKASMRIQTASQRLEFEDVLKVHNVTKSAGAFPVLMKSVKKVDIEYLLSISLKRENRSPEGWKNLRQSIFNGQMVLLDTKGRIVAGRATENGGNYTTNKIDATLRFVREPGLSDAGAGEPYKLVWDAPTAAKDLSVEFELKDIPIPE